MAGYCGRNEGSDKIRTIPTAPWTRRGSDQKPVCTMSGPGNGGVNGQVPAEGRTLCWIMDLTISDLDKGREQGLDRGPDQGLRTQYRAKDWAIVWTVWGKGPPRTRQFRVDCLLNMDRMMDRTEDQTRHWILV